MVYDSRLAGVTSIVRNPRLGPIIVTRHHETTVRYDHVAKLRDDTAIGAAGGGIATFQQDVSGCDGGRLSDSELRTREFCFLMPLIGLVPEGDHADCIKKYGIHG
jgi:hypothetical protein